MKIKFGMREFTFLLVVYRVQIVMSANNNCNMIFAMLCSPTKMHAKLLMFHNTLLWMTMQPKKLPNLTPLSI